MKFRWDNRYLHWGVTAFLVIAASMLFYYGIFHMKTLIVGIKTFLGIMAPIIYGVILAYILSPLINLFEQKLIYPQLEKHNIKLQKKGKRAIRWGCVLFSMFLFWIIIYALLMMVLPQLIRSIMSIIYSFPYYIKVIEKWLNSFVEHGWKLNPEMLDMINQYSAKAQEYLTTDILPQNDRPMPQQQDCRTSFFCEYSLFLFLVCRFVLHVLHFLRAVFLVLKNTKLPMPEANFLHRRFLSAIFPETARRYTANFPLENPTAFHNHFPWYPPPYLRIFPHFWHQTVFSTRPLLTKTTLISTHSCLQNRCFSFFQIILFPPFLNCLPSLDG